MQTVQVSKKEFLIIMLLSFHSLIFLFIFQFVKLQGRRTYKVPGRSRLLDRLQCLAPCDVRRRKINFVVDQK